MPLYLLFPLPRIFSLRYLHDLLSHKDKLKSLVGKKSNWYYEEAITLQRQNDSYVFQDFSKRCSCSFFFWIWKPMLCFISACIDVAHLTMCTLGSLLKTFILPDAPKKRSYLFCSYSIFELGASHKHDFHFSLVNWNMVLKRYFRPVEQSVLVLSIQAFLLLLFCFWWLVLFDFICVCSGLVVLGCSDVVLRITKWIITPWKICTAL